MQSTFSEFGLDPRVVRAIFEQTLARPTAVQSACIPQILEGINVAAQAPCGSGKTAAYLLPIISLILTRKKAEQGSAKPVAGPPALILVPTRELVDHVYHTIQLFTVFCSTEGQDGVRAAKITDAVSETVNRSQLSNSPDIVIATPTGAWKSVSASGLSLSDLAHVVLDEADLLIPCGYHQDVEKLWQFVPQSAQVVLMSATLTADMKALTSLSRRPFNQITIQDEKDSERLSQFVVECAEDEKFLLAYVFFKLDLIKGKTVVFVGGDVDRAYRLRLFLEQFGIRSCVYNPEMPTASRHHILEQFNQNVYNIVIAADPGTNHEYDLSRGIDFHNVATVLNFDMPTSASAYAHRIGRTARVNRTGTAISFVIPKALYGKHKPTKIESAAEDESILATITVDQASQGRTLKPLKLNKQQVDPFRYRFADALRSVTRVASRQARTRELRNELLKSTKLQRYFEENPLARDSLRHDTEVRIVKQQPHLKHVPGYLLPAGSKAVLQDQEELTSISKKEIGAAMAKRRKGKDGAPRKSKVGARKDPLKSFKAR